LGFIYQVLRGREPSCCDPQQGREPSCCDPQQGREQSCCDPQPAAVSDLGLFFSAAERMGVEKRLPLIFAILAEGRELGLPKEYLEPLRTEWNKGISGRCHGNTAGVLGDLTAMVLVVQERYPMAMKDLVRDACAFVNRSGQVKWASEKDLFGACSLLWYLAVERQWDGYDKNYRILAKKWCKQFPDSPLSLFFSAETHWLEEGWQRYRMTVKTRDMYREFLKRIAHLKNDPIYQYYVTKAEQRIEELDNPNWIFDGAYGAYDEDDDEDDDDDDEFDFDDEEEDEDEEFDFDDDMPRGMPTGMPRRMPFGTQLSPEIRRDIKKSGGFSGEMKRQMEKTFPRAMAPLGKLMIEAMEECVLKDLPENRFMDVVERKMANLSWFEQMQIMAAMSMGRLPFGGGRGGEEDDLPPRSSRKKQRKKR